MSVVTLLTDFGTADGYVAAMKGVLRGIVPEARLDDAGHDVPQGDVPRAAWALGRYWSLYPPGSVHLVVVDPGVGTERRALAFEADGRFVVAPDNGVASRVLDGCRKWRAVEPRAGSFPSPGGSATFHGRDVFAPVAGVLARGDDLGDLGRSVPDPVRLTEPDPIFSADGIEGEVVVVDGFGNLITNVGEDALPPTARVRVAGRSLPLRHTYGSVDSGELLALVDSAGRLEIAVRDGSAESMLGAGAGLRVRVETALISPRRASGDPPR